MIKAGDKINIPSRLYVPKGEITAGEKNEVICNVKMYSQDCVLIFVAESEKIYALSRGEANEIEEEEKIFEDLSNKLKEANEKNDENAIKDAKDEIGKALTKSGDASGASRLTEIRRLKGKKITYVRSDKIKNHWRSYSLNVDDNKKSLRTNKGKLDKDRLGKQFKDVQTKIKQEWKKDYGTSVAGHEIFFGEIIDEINESLKWSINEQNADPEEINFDVSTEARLLRFYAGASGGWTFDPVKGNFGITGKVSASIALAELKFMSSAY